MRFKLVQSVLIEEIEKVILREIKEQKLDLLKLSSLRLREIAEVGAAIHEHGLPPYLVKRKISAELGYGIFLHPKAKPIQKGQVIAPYAGEISILPERAEDKSTYAFDLLLGIRLTKEEQERFGKPLLYHPKRLYSLKLDARNRGNFTRFINHSETPNVVAHLVTIPKNSYNLPPSPIEIVYFAKKTIHPGEQLLVSYEDGAKNYWAPCKIKPFPMSPQTFRLSESLKVIKT